MRITPITLILLITGSIALAQTTSDKPTASKVPAPQIVSAKEWGSTPKPLPDERKHTPKFITIHHAGVLWKPGDDPIRKLKGLQAYGQREKNWPDLPYHFLIAPDGRIFQGRDIQYEPESNTKYELQGNIGVELFGNFEEQRVNEAQLKSLVHLIAYLSQQHQIDLKTLRGHKDIAQTVCPGKDLYRYLTDQDLQRWTGEMLKGKEPAVELKAPVDKGPTELIR